MQQPNLDTPQTGEAELLPLLQPAPGSETMIRTPAQWEAKRQGVQETLDVILGVPTDIKLSKEPVEILGEEKLEKYTRIHMNVPGEAGDPIPSYLFP